jgi:outer membrane protein TolC
MGQVRKLSFLLLGGLLTATGCYTTDCGDRDLAPLSLAPAPLAPPAAPAPAATPELPGVPPPQPDDRPLPINLPTALKLANARNQDIAAAAQRIQVAAALLEQARVMWLPTVTLGADYYRHDGVVNDPSSGDVFNNSHSSTLLGAGSGIGPASVASVDDAIFAPLYARKQVRARQADLQASANDTLVAVSDAYFNVQQARGNLTGAIEATRRTEDLVARTRKLAPAVVPDLELFRAETELARRHETELFARENWKVASAELLRVLHLTPSVQVDPAEPPQLRVELIDLKKSVEELIPIGLTYRPELASQQAQVQATLARVQQEHLRPFLPYVLLRGNSTNPGGTLAGGVDFPTPFGSKAGARFDMDLQVLWQLDNLGFGNRALVHQWQAENRLAVAELFRIEDRVATEVAQAHAQAQLAAQRVTVTETGLRSAVLSADKNLAALRETKGVGNQFITLVRPQEVVAAIQALSQAYIDYYGAVADANRAQFRLYRALGQPAQCVLRQEQMPKEGAPTSLPPAAPGRPDEESRKATSESQHPTNYQLSITPD